VILWRFVEFVVGIAIHIVAAVIAATMFVFVLAMLLDFVATVSALLVMWWPS
jgi:hypothetical protein